MTYQKTVSPSSTFIQSLQDTVIRRNDSTFATWYNKHGNASAQYSFAQMWEEAGEIAYHLRVEEKLSKGDRVVLCYSFGLQFFATFLGCLRAGVTAVLVYPPDPNNLAKTLPKMTSVTNDCDAKIVLMSSDINYIRMYNQSQLNFLSKSRHLWPGNTKFMDIHAEMRKSRAFMSTFSKKSRPFVDDSITENDIAFLQYTSGSTGSPKGVMVPFGAVQANVNEIISSVSKPHAEKNLSGGDIVGFSWLPQYHDMGLIYAIIAPFAAGWRCNMMSPTDFVQNPLLWIDLMSRLKVTWSAAPDFAYGLVARKFTLGMKHKEPERLGTAPQSPIENLDLSSIVYLQNAAEPIRSATKDQFEEAFKEYGLSNDWFVSGYGMAENVVATCHLRKYQLSRHKSSTNGKSLIAVAHRSNLPQGQSIKIVCTESHKELDDGEVGELWISGPSVTAGYFNKPQLTEETFHAKIKNGGGSDASPNHDNDDKFLRTGDLAFFEDDYLYICGRQKDLIIVNGVNYYPQDIEHAVQNASDTAVRPGCVAAFATNDAGNDGEVEIVFEIRDTSKTDAMDVVGEVYAAIIQEIGLVPSRVVAIKERTIRKTTSGKIQRKANRKALHEKHLHIIHEHATSTSFELPERKYDSSISGQDPFDKIMRSFFGSDYDASRNWYDLGMSSMTSIQLRDALLDTFSVTLSPDCFELHPTPESLKDHVAGNQGTSLMVSLPILTNIRSMKLSWSWVIGLVQALCSVFLLFVFAFPIVPAWYLGKLLANTASTTVRVPGTDVNISWSWVPLVVPAWMLCFSLIVILLKWMVIGKYKNGIVPIPSAAYLRWWFVDRAVGLWESCVGAYVRDTPVINAFYTLMGAKIHRSAAVDGFIREFDLIDIGQNASIEHSIRCHKFGPWSEESAPTIRFRTVSIGSQSIVKGMVCLGASVGDGAFVEKLSVMAEGSRAPSMTRVVGNPAFTADTVPAPESKHPWWKLGLLKVSWLMFELYLFFGTTFLGQYLWVAHLPRDWRYAPLLMWCLLILWFSTASIGTSIIIKWVLIGKRKPGPYKDTLFRAMADWAADWHCKSYSMVYNISINSRLWNVVLMAHGMDIDIKSKVFAEYFLPSKMDLMKVRKSFISVLSWNAKFGGRYQQIEVDESSVGFAVHIEPSADMKISGAIVPPLSTVTSSIITRKDIGSFEKDCYSLIWAESCKLGGYLGVFGIIFCSFIPSYELWTSVFNPMSIWDAVPALASAITLHNMIWVLVLKSIGWVALAGYEENKDRPRSSNFYGIYHSCVCTTNLFSFTQVLLGSPAFNCVMRMLGSKFEGQALIFSSAFYEYSLLTFADKTIADTTNIHGHYVVYEDITIGPCMLSGVMHPGTYATNACITSKESGPLRPFVGTYNDGTGQDEMLA